MVDETAVEGEGGVGREGGREKGRRWLESVVVVVVAG